MENHRSTANAASSVVWIEDEPQAMDHCCKAYPVPGRTQFTIGELSCEFGVTLRALRFYEDKGLVTPARDGNMRLYSENDRTRLAAILTGKKLGFTLAEIRTMIAAKDGAPNAEILRVTKDKCLEQIHLLEKQQLSIKEALADLWRMHARLSADRVRVDGKKAVGGDH